jgi:iron complex outermembrane recepter protein
VTPYERFNFYGEGRYEVSDSVEVYGRGLFSKNIISSVIAPSGVFGENLTVPGNSPFLNTSLRNQLCTLNGIALGPTCDTNPAIPLGIVYRRSVELGPRVDTYTTNVFDLKVGAKFNITNSISFDLYGTYGESENTQVRSGYVARSRIQQALNATNTTTCINPANGCVPLNLFGQPGSITPEMGGFIGGITSSITQFASLAQVNGVLSGKTGFALPWAEDEVSFAVGGEYRQYEAARRPDNLAQVPGELGGAGGAITPFSGGYNTREIFGELVLPLVQDKPFFDELVVTGGVRYSKYSIDAAGDPKFNATSWGVGVNWRPVDALKLRANYQKAVRAPNIGELFAPVTTGLTNLATDPCAGARPVGNANLTAVCLAQGAPLATIGSIQEPAAGQANSTGGGNPNVGPETAKTLTVGAVFTPNDLIPGLTLSVDYYRIKVTDAITAPLPADVISACFGDAVGGGVTAASATNPACTAIRRNPATGRLSGSPATTPGLPTPLSNAGILFTKGFDIIANYKTDLGFAALTVNVAANHTIDSKFAASESAGFGTDCPGIYSANCGIAIGQIQPKWSTSTRVTLGFDNIDVSLLWRHITSAKYDPALPRLCGPNPSNAACTGVVRGIGPFVGQSIDLNRIPAYDYFDLTTRFTLTDNLDLTITAFNLFDKKPPLLGGNAGSTAANSGNTFPSTYDVVGRRYSATARLRF